MQPQLGETLVWLEAFVQSPEDGGDGGVAKPEGSSGKNIGGRGVCGWIVSFILSNEMFKRLGADDLWKVISEGYYLEDETDKSTKQKNTGIRLVRSTDSQSTTH